MRHKKRFAAVIASTAALSLVGMGLALADVGNVDGDLAAPGGSPAVFSSTSQCAGTDTIDGALTLTYNGNDHFVHDEALTFTFYAPAGITVDPPTSATVPSTWTDKSAQSYTFTTHVANSVYDGDYQVGVSVAGGTSGYAVGKYEGSGRPQYTVSVSCGRTAPVIDPSTPPAVNSAPVVDAGGPYSGNEGSAISLSGASASDADNDPLTYSWSAVGDSNNYTGSACTFSDSTVLNPTITCNDNGTWTLTLAVSDGKVSSPVSDTATLTVSNVAPTVTGISGPTTVLTNTSYSYTGSATDPSSVDTGAGFSWAWTGGNATTLTGNPFSTQFTTCGPNTVSATATDKDLGASAAYSLSTISAYDGGFKAPITAGVYNAVPKGYVLPVKIYVGCNGVFNSSLTPAIQLYSGDADPATDPSDATQAISTTSSSSADQGQVMRLADGQYIYNLQVPATATVGQLYTVIVRPFGTSNPTQLRAVLKIRK